MTNRQVKEIKVENYEFHPDPKRPNLVSDFGINLILEDKVIIELAPVQAGRLLEELSKHVKGMMNRFGIISF